MQTNKAEVAFHNIEETMGFNKGYVKHILTPEQLTIYQACANKQFIKIDTMTREMIQLIYILLKTRNFGYAKLLMVNCDKLSALFKIWQNAVNNTHTLFQQCRKESNNHLMQSLLHNMNYSTAYKLCDDSYQGIKLRNKIFEVELLQDGVLRELLYLYESFY